MKEFSHQVKAAIEANRIGRFVHIDLLYFPMHVHDGIDTVEWGGHKWKGMSDDLNIPWPIPTAISPVGKSASNQVADVTVPLDRKLGEALVHGYFVGRNLQVIICALTESGEVLQRIFSAEGEITKCSTTDSITITFHAELTELDGNSDPTRDFKQFRDANHKAAVRDRFKQNVFGIALSQAKGDVADIANALISLFVSSCTGVLAFVENLLSSSLGRLFRLIRQRWSARKRCYAVAADGVQVLYLGGALKLRLCRRFRADNERDAVIKFFEYVKRRIWRIPSGIIHLHFSINGKPSVTLMNLDHFRKENDPQKWADTNPIRNWGTGEADDQAR